MLKLINLFFIGIFIISCGGEVGRVYHNGAPSTGSGGNTGNTGNPSTKNPIVAKLECLPGTSCNKDQAPIRTNKSNSCLPGVECNPLDVDTDTNKDKDKDKSKDKGSKTDGTSNNKKKDCLPGQTSC